MHTKLMTKGQAVDLLKDIGVELERGGSLEGTLRYRAIKPGIVEVFAAMRTMNEFGQGGVSLIEGLPIFVEGWTKAGNYVRIEGDPYGRDRDKAVIFVDEEFIDGRDCEMNRRRDGGSTDIRLPDGRVIFKPNSLGVPGPQPAMLGSETIEPLEPIG